MAAWPINPFRSKASEQCPLELEPPYCSDHDCVSCKEQREAQDQSRADTLVPVLAELAARQPIARILSVTYDDALRRTRHMLLEAQGYEVISTDGLESTLEQCKLGGFDLFLLGHSIPVQQKHKMVEAFRQVSPAPIVSLRRHTEGRLDTADYHVEPDPEPLLELIADLIRHKSAAKG